MTKDLVGRIDHVIAIEPDDRMRRVLAENLPGVRAVKGVGESIPLGDACADAVLASSSWHWMDADLALREAARVLVPSGTLAAVWTGPDPDGPFVVQAQALLSEMSSGGAGPDGNGSPRPDLGATVVDSENRVDPVLRIPGGSPFAQPEGHVLTWDVALTADELIGLLGTFSWIITMTADRRAYVIDEARRVLRDGLGVSGDVTVDVQYRCEAWRTRLT
jgi:SAM-dependent methyltransferase